MAAQSTTDDTTANAGNGTTSTTPVSTTPDDTNTKAALSSIKQAYHSLNSAMMSLLDDQAKLAAVAVAPAASASASTPATGNALAIATNAANASVATAPAVSVDAATAKPVIGFETIDKEIEILYSAIAQVNKIKARMHRRSKEIISTTK